MRYIAELEHKVQILQTEATTLAAQINLLQVHHLLPPLDLVQHPSIFISLTEIELTDGSNSMAQRDSSAVATQNNELRFRLQAMEQQAQLRDGALRVPSLSHTLLVVRTTSARQRPSVRSIHPLIHPPMCLALD